MRSTSVDTARDVERIPTKSMSDLDTPMESSPTRIRNVSAGEPLPALDRHSSIRRIASKLSGTSTNRGIRKRDFGFLPIPPNKRYDPGLKVEECFPWTLRLNLIFAICATVSVANLYYNQPMLVKYVIHCLAQFDSASSSVAIAEDFNTDHNHVSQITTLVQAGYACGIFFISPLGDLVRRRQALILLMTLGSLFSIGCALATSVEMLVGFSFLTGVVTVTPQLMIPWSADLSPARIRARSMAITLSGLILGLSMGRVLGGIISNFASWRDVYWMAVGLQGCAVLLEYWMLPDAPDKGIGLSYFQVLYTMLSYYFKYPTLTQACVSYFCNSCVFAGFWTVQTFLLSSHYSFSSLAIGLMGLLGLFGAIVAPFSGRLVDRVIPWLAQLIGLLLAWSGMLIALFTAEKSVVAIAISVTMFDTGNQLFQVSSSYRVAGLDPKARARLNGCVLLALFAGQTSGTAILTHIYNAHGWHPTGSTAIALSSFSLLALLARGPHETGWIGWRGGASLKRKRVLGKDDGPDAITEGAAPMVVQRTESDVEKGRIEAQRARDELAPDGVKLRPTPSTAVEAQTAEEDVPIEVPGAQGEKAVAIAAGHRES